MSTERLSGKRWRTASRTCPAPNPTSTQLLAAGRAMRRRRVGVVASLAAAAVLVLVLAGLSFAWAGRTGRALEPVPANPTTSATIGAAFTSELQQWIDALPAGAPPATPYWHDGILYVNGEQIPAPYAAVDIKVAGDTVLVGGYESEPKDVCAAQWALVRGDRLEPVPVPAGTGDVGLSVDGRIAYWVDRQEPGTTRFFTWDTETNTALASRTVPGHRRSNCWGSTPPEAATGRPTWTIAAPHPMGCPRRHDPSDRPDLDPAQPPEMFDGFVPWMHTEDAYRSPDGTKRVFTDSVPSDSPSDCCVDRLRVRPVGPDDRSIPRTSSPWPFPRRSPTRGLRVGRRERVLGVVGVQRVGAVDRRRRPPDLPGALLGHRRGLPARRRLRPRTPPDGRGPRRTGR